MSRRKQVSATPVAIADPLARYRTVLASAHLEGFIAEICDYQITEAFETIHDFPNTYILDMSLTPRPAPARVSYVDRWGDRSPENLGRLLLVPPGLKVHGSCSPGSQRSLRCEISRSLLEGRFGWRPTWTDHALKEGLHLQSWRMERKLQEMVDELLHPGLKSSAMLESLAMIVCLELVRHFEWKASSRSVRTGGLAPWRLGRIYERAADPFPIATLSELAELCGVTTRHMSRTFLEETGRTVAEFVRDMAMTRARDLLETSDVPISELGSALGYSTAASFSQVFMKQFGMRPRDVRTKYATAALIGPVRAAVR
jgi:AraC family transcriptional regulator